MSTNLEIEFKNMLTKEEYIKLLKLFNKENLPLIVQQNLYFDTPTESLKHKKSALRIRVKNHTYELTLKLVQPIGLLEINQMISHDEMLAFTTKKQFPHGQVYDSLVKEHVAINELTLITDLTTKRFECPYQSGLLVLDESHYHDLTDYELEYEVQAYDEGLRHFNELLHHYHIPKRPAQSKIKRATDAMHKKR